MPRTSLSPSTRLCSIRGTSENTLTGMTQTRLSAKWTSEEHERFLSALALYPNGSWKAVAEIVGTRTVRQVMSHAHKLAQKQQRHSRGLKPAGRPRRTTPVSPTAIEDVDAVHKAVSSPSRHRHHGVRRRTDPYKTRLHTHIKDGTDGPWRLYDVDNRLDEGPNDYRAALFHAEDGTVKFEIASTNTDDGRPLWSHDDIEWFAKLMWLNGW